MRQQSVRARLLFPMCFSAQTSVCGCVRACCVRVYSACGSIAKQRRACNRRAVTTARTLPRVTEYAKSNSPWVGGTSLLTITFGICANLQTSFRSNISHHNSYRSDCFFFIFRLLTLFKVPLHPAQSDYCGMAAVSR